MSIFYVELNEAVSVPGNYSLRLFTLRGKPEDSVDGNWFEFEERPNRTLVARYQGKHEVVVVTPFENIKQMHEYAPLPARTPAPASKSK